LSKARTKIKLAWGTLTKIDGDKWKVRWSECGKRRHITIYAPNRQRAIEQAEEARHTPIRQGQRFRPGMAAPDEQNGRLLIEDAFLRAADSRSWRRDTRQDFVKYSIRFLEWARLQYWDEVTREDVARYEKYLWGKGLRPNTVRLYLWAVKFTAKWMYLTGKYPNICEGYRMRKRPNVEEYDEGKALTISQVCDFLQWLSESRHKDLAPGIALQGLAGLRVTEALRLTWENVDLANGTITIAGVVKNSSSVRRIPVASVVQEALIAAKGTGRVVNKYRSLYSYGKAFRRAVKEWDSSLVLPPKELRNTIPSAAFDGGWDSRYVDRYLGHTATSMKEKHYQKVKRDRLVTLLHEHVVKRIEGEINLHRQKGAKVIHLRPERKSG